MKLNEYIEKLNENKALFQDPLAGVQPDLAMGAQYRAQEAYSRYKGYSAELANAIPELGGAIFVSGPGAVKFSEIAEDEVPSVTLDATEFYRRLATAWGAPLLELRERRFNVHHAVNVIAAMRAQLGHLGISTCAAPKFDAYVGRDISTMESMVALTRDMMREIDGEALNEIYLRWKLVASLEELEWPHAFVPVVVLGDDSEGERSLSSIMFGGSNIQMRAEENVEVNDVFVAYKKLKAAMKGSKKSQTK